MTIGMPESIYLEWYGVLLSKAFDKTPYHVGSSLKQKIGWRDVDVRIILSDKEWKKYGFGDMSYPNLKWSVYCSAFSELGKKITGLPIDFQIQHEDIAQKYYGSDEYGRSALGIMWNKEDVER